MSNRASVSVQPVQTKSDKKLFLQLPWQLYAEDNFWIPPLRLNQKELVNFKPHPFYDDAEIQTFLARRNGRVCGRIAAILDHAHNRYNDDNRGMFGFFESINDRAVSDALFDAAKAWFSERNIQDMRGPLNPSMNYE